MKEKVSTAMKTTLSMMIVVMVLLVIGGVKTHPGPKSDKTNEETLEQSVNSKKEGHSQAQAFFGHFTGDYRTFVT
jgi:hypothetical protein